MTRVAYITGYTCGFGHAARGAAFAARGIRAFGPAPWQDGPGLLPVPEGFEASDDWEARALAWQPDLLLVDLAWWRSTSPLTAIRRWALLRWMEAGTRGLETPGWERRISIEPAADVIPGITHRVPPIVGPDRWRPPDGSEVRAGYNAWWESVWYGWHDRVRWTTDGSPERQARIDAGPVLMAENGANVLMAMVHAALGDGS